MWRPAAPSLGPRTGGPVALSVVTARTYAIRTYGCQMNEHDSERLAGLLEADGLVPAASENEADVVVLNTCCIRENADNKLYGKLGHLKSQKAERPGLRDHRQRLPGPEGPRPHPAAGRPRRRRGRHPQRAPGRRAAARRRASAVRSSRSGTRRSTRPRPSPRPCRSKREVDFSAWVTIQIGCDNTCAFCIVPSVRGQEISRPFGELVAEVERLAADGVSEVTLLGQNVNSYGRDLTSDRRTAEPSIDDDARGRVPVGHRPCSPGPAAVRRPARRGGAVDGIRPGALHQPPPQGPAARDHRGHGRQPGGLQPPPPARCSPAATASSPPCTGATPPSATSRSWPPPGPASPDLAVTTDLIVGFPGETDDDFEQTLEVVAEAPVRLRLHVHLLAPRRAPRRPSWPTASSTRRSWASASSASGSWSSARRWPSTASPGRSHRGGRGRGSVASGPVASSPAAPARTSSCTSRRPRRCGPAPWPPPWSPSAGPHFLRGELVEVLAAPRHRTRIPVAAG